MLKNKNLILLYSMSPAERIAFEQYVAASYFNNRKGLIKTIETIFKYFAETKDSTSRLPITEEVLYAKVQQAKVQQAKEQQAKEQQAKEQQGKAAIAVFKPETIANEITKLGKLAQTFFVHERIKNDALLMQRYQLEELRRRNLSVFIGAKGDEITKVVRPENQLDSVALYTTYWEIEDNTNRFREMSLSRKPNVDDNIAATSRSLDALFLLNKIRYMVIAKNHDNILNVNGETEVLGGQFVLAWLEQNPNYLTEHPLLKTYYLLWQLQKTQPDSAGFDEISSFIQSVETQFDALEMDTIYTLLTNYCVAKNNESDRVFLYKANDLYKRGFANKYFNQNNNTIVAVYKNVIKIMRQCNEYHEVGVWMTALADLKTPNAITMHAHCQALLAFDKKDYDKAIELAKELNFDNATDHLDNLFILLRSYFCLPEHEEEFDKVKDNLDKRIKAASKQITVGNALRRSNFVNLLSRVNTHKRKPRDKQNTAAIEKNKVKLLTEIKNTDPVFFKEWLVAQLKDMK